MVKLKEFFYLANIIDYGRVITLYWALRADDGWGFAVWYSVSYLLDCVDGYAARALGQESRLGYYLDMVIDRISSVCCLYKAAQELQQSDAVVPKALSGPMVAMLYLSIVVVEIGAHTAVMYMSEVLNIHQKRMGYDWTVVRMYLTDKRCMFVSCVSFEVFGLGLIIGNRPAVLVALPGFLFRAVANTARLVATATMSSKLLKEPSPPSSEDRPRRGSKDTTSQNTSPREARWRK